jgi:hypothetical protein
MAILKQNENTQAIYLGWYGQCGDPVCKEFDLTQSSSVIEKVFQFTENGTGIKTFVTNVPESMIGFDKLICGNPYYIVLKKGADQLDIPDFVTGFHDENSKNFGMITKNCTTAYARPPVDDDKETPPVVEKPCTKDVRVCPDGSYVGRDGFMDCNFPPCGFDSDLHESMKKIWKENQHNHYKFDFNWSCYCTEEMTQTVTLYVRYEKIYKIVKKESSQEISLNQNEGIEESEDKKPVPMKYRSMADLYNWINQELKKHPFSISSSYNRETGFISSIFIDKVQDIADEEIGFSATNFEILDLDGKCPSDIKRCKDGTLLKRDPNNDCKFPVCPDVPVEPPTSIDVAKLEYRWLKQGSYQFLQIKNILNPWVQNSTDDAEKYLSWRTVYGSREVNPDDNKLVGWKPAVVEYQYSTKHGDVEDYDGVTIGIDDDNRNHLITLLGSAAEFLPNPDTIESASHLYVFENDTETTSHKAWSYPRIVKKVSDAGCPEDAKVCSDGSVVTRNPNNNCEFNLCPDETEFVIDETPFSIQEGMGDILTTPIAPWIDDTMIDDHESSAEETAENTDTEEIFNTPTSSSISWVDDTMIGHDNVSNQSNDSGSDDGDDEVWYSLE